MTRLTKKDYIDWEYRTGYYNKKYVKHLNEKTLKLGKLEDLEEELNCPLEIIVKALKEDIIDTEGSQVSVCLEYRQITKEWLLIGKFCHTAYLVKDYQKTWWLKGEKDE